MGLLESLGNMLSGATARDPASGYSPMDRIGMFASSWNGDNDALARLRNGPAARADQQWQGDWLKRLQQAQAGVPVPAQPAQPVMNDQGADISSAFAPQQDTPATTRQPTLQDLLPLLTEGIAHGRNTAPIATLYKDAAPPKKVGFNTPAGLGVLDPETGDARIAVPAPPKPQDPLTPDKVIGPIIAKRASGGKLSTGEQFIFNRWLNGTPSKAKPAAAAPAASFGLPNPASRYQ